MMDLNEEEKQVISVQPGPSDSAEQKNGQDELGGNRSFSSTSTLDTLELPPTKYPRWYSQIRWGWGSVYIRLNVIVCIANLTTILVLVGQGRLLSRTVPQISTAVAANLTAAILMRQDWVINFLFVTASRCPQWWPMRIRRLVAKVYHFGGIHSGAAVSALLWFAVLNAVTVRVLSTPDFAKIRVPLLTIMAALDIELLAIVVFSHPQFRRQFHNTWECIHRFAGWSAIALIWVFFGLFISTHHRQSNPESSLAMSFVVQPSFWMLNAITMCLILPWLRLRKVSLECSPLSTHAARLHFDYTTLPLCAALRVTDAPLREWHSFAGIPEPNGTGYSLIVSKAGDWTSKIIRERPRKLWIRGLPVHGVLHIAPIFKSMVLVTTGSGIGPVMSLLLARELDCRILWSTKDPVATYGTAIVEAVRQADPQAVIIDSKKGRPDMVRETWKLYQESGAEVVFCVSNPTVTAAVQYELESRGIPVFAPIFDS